MLTLLFFRDHSADPVENIATVIDPTYQSSIPTPLTTNQTSMSIATGKLPAHLEYISPDSTTTPIPPYMPIQGTRRTNGLSQPDKKKKSKDSKCTHQ